MMDHRSIPLDVLREFVRARAEVSSLRVVAEESGVGRTTLFSFLKTTIMPHARTRRLLGLWYLSEQGKAPDIDIVRPYEAAVSVLLAALPDAEREAARALLVDDLHALYAQAHAVPRWLELLQSTLNKK